MQRIRISGAGCSLADLLYTNIDFEGPSFARFRSSTQGDGGLVPGKLVFAEEIERFSGLGIHEILAEISGGRQPASRNLGGPAIVALINAAQLLHDVSDVELSFLGAAGNDDAGRFILQTISETAVDIHAYKLVTGDSPVTYVLSDPSYHDGHGERTFINNVAAAWQLGPEDLDDSFFESDILLFGGTGLVPRLHDGLTGLLRRGKELGRRTIVTTVYDFRNEKLDPVNRWPLGSSDESYRYIDLLITDREEAFRLSGTRSTNAAADFFRRRGVGAFIMTSGPDPIEYFSRGDLFAECEGTLPVSSEVTQRLRGSGGVGDTTGCGDNFAGGVVASLALQLLAARGDELDLPSACALGVVSGGFACFYLGGTFHERRPGEKRDELAPIYQSYRRQIGPLVAPFDRMV